MRVWAPCVLLLVAPAQAAQERLIDLGSPGIQQEVTVKAGEALLLGVQGLAPGARYRWVVRVEQREIEPLPQPQVLSDAAAGAPVACLTLEGATRLLLDHSLREADVPAKADGVKRALGDLTAADRAACRATADRAARALERVHQPLGAFVLEEDERLVVVVERLDEQGSPERTWSRIFGTEPSGNWYASYGFVFTGDEDDRYFTQPGEEEGTFLIRKEADNRELSFVPMVFYSWEARRAWPGKGFSIGPAGGLGFDQSDPVVALGLNVTYRRNLSIVAGGLVRKFTRLRGKYDEADLPISVGESLTPDELTEQTWAPAVFFGLSLRFGKSPFAAADRGSESSKEETEDKP